MFISKIGWVALNEVAKLDFSRYLTANEMEAIHYSNHERKRVQKKAVRLLLKTLFLTRGGHEKPLGVSPNLLSEYSKEDYQRIEIISSNAGDKHLAIYQEGIEVNCWNSISHGTEISVACLSNQAGIGIDIEIPTAHRREFYVQNFTSYERAWVYDNFNSKTNEDELFTFLWTLKESLIKSGCTTQQSAWYIPEFSINELPPFKKFENTLETHFTIYDGKEHFQASTRLYSIDSQVLTTTFFCK